MPELFLPELLVDGGGGGTELGTHVGDDVPVHGCEARQSGTVVFDDAVHAAVDVARLGAWASRGYDCRFRTIDDSITPENRVLIGLAPRGRATATDAAAAIEAAADAKMAAIRGGAQDQVRRRAAECAS